MKRNLVLILLSLLGTSMIAQSKEKPCMEDIKARKVAYITEVVQLTPEEAQVFWPLYNEFQQKNMEMHKKRRKLVKQIENSASEADYEAVNDAMIQLDVDEVLLRKTYYEKYKTILSAEKIHRLFKAEHGFKKVLLESFEKK